MALEPRPEREARDEVRWLLNSAIAAIPYAGGSVNEILNRLLRPSIEKRHEAWLDELADAVSALIEQVGGLDESTLAANELFVSGVVQASRISLGTALDEKRNMLRNGLMQLAKGDLTDDFLTQRYLAFVEELMPEHFVVLEYATNPRLHHTDWGVNDSGTPLYLLSTAPLGFDRKLNDLVLSDLRTRRLIVDDDLGTVGRGANALRPFSTVLGLGLIEFVMKPSLPEKVQGSD